MAETIDVAYVRRIMGRLDVTRSNIQQLSRILIGCTFYGMLLYSRVSQ